MSENRITIVDLDVDLDAAAVRALEVTDWLLESRVVIRNPNPDAIMQPSDLVPGPRVTEASPEAHQFIGLWNNGVDVVARRELHHPFGNEEAAPCPVCGTAMPDGDRDSIEAWIEGVEPIVTCGTCGTPNRIGDWVHPFTFYVGNLAVCFNNWSPLTDEFTTKLGDRLGHRWRVVLAHI
jgi:hypothetical protein